MKQTYVQNHKLSFGILVGLLQFGSTSVICNLLIHSLFRYKTCNNTVSTVTRLHNLGLEPSTDKICLFRMSRPVPGCEADHSLLHLVLNLSTRGWLMNNKPECG